MEEHAKFGVVVHDDNARLGHWGRHGANMSVLVPRVITNCYGTAICNIA